jgi:SagB-type dehydrogenase family enzyme
MTTTSRLTSSLLLAAAVGLLPRSALPQEKPLEQVELPRPRRTSEVSLEEAFAARRSLRTFAQRPLDQAQLGQLLWAAQGITGAGGRGRTAPSAGALYPLELYVATAEGLFRYEPRAHSLERRLARDPRPELAKAALGQESVRQAPAVFVISGVEARTRAKYGARARRYVHLEAGHAGQNLLLQAAALGLGAVPVGAFEDDQVRRVLSLPAGEAPLYLIPVGPRKN